MDNQALLLRTIVTWPLFNRESKAVAVLVAVELLALSIGTYLATTTSPWWWLLPAGTLIVHAVLGALTVALAFANMIEGIED